MNETEQTAFWRGEFGDSYVGRNELTAQTMRASRAKWARILQSVPASHPRSILEVGANVGINLAALSELTAAELHGVEPNSSARAVLTKRSFMMPGHIHDALGDKLPYGDGEIDMVFTSGVLIHVAPERLEATCREMHRVAKRYVACVEYFADQPTEMVYRGHQGKLFKRDFGGYWWELFPALSLVDYGFFWRRATGLDNLTWWLFEKN